MRYKEYQGEFMSQGGVLWRVEIWSEADAAFPAVGSLRFPYDTPLTIEWDTKELHEPLCGAVATLTVVSETDRQFTSFYRTAVCGTQLRVYRQGVLFWSGTLNTEEYTEPFQTYDGYEVTLTFSDLGAAEYVRFSPRGQVVTLQEMLAWARYDLGLSLVNSEYDTSAVAIRLNYAFIGYDTVRELTGKSESAESQKYNGYEKPENLRFLAVNYYDRSENVYKPWQEALQDVCTALGARLMQWWGRLILYSPDGLFQDENTARDTEGVVRWTADEQTLEMGKVYNNVKITATASDDALTLLTGDDGDTTMQGEQFEFSTKGPYYYDQYDTSVEWTNVKLPPNTITVMNEAGGEVAKINEDYLRPVVIEEGNDGIGGRKALLWHCMAGQPQNALVWFRDGNGTKGVWPPTGITLDRFNTWQTAGGKQMFTKGKKLFTSAPFFLIGTDLMGGSAGTTFSAADAPYYLGVNVPLLATCLQNPAYSPTLADCSTEYGTHAVDDKEWVWTSDTKVARTDPNGLLRHRELYHAASLSLMPYTIFIRNARGYVTCYLHAKGTTDYTGKNTLYGSPEWVTVKSPSSTDPVPDMPAFLVHNGCTKVKDGDNASTSSLGKDFDDACPYSDAESIYNMKLSNGESAVNTMANMELLDRPPVSGQAELVVYEGLFFKSFNPQTYDPYPMTYYPKNDKCERFDNYGKDEYRLGKGDLNAYREAYKYLYWVAYGLPQVSYIVRNTCKEISPEPKEYNTAVDTAYKNSLELETSLGSQVDEQSLGVGAFFMHFLNAQTGVTTYKPMTHWRNRLITTGTAADWDDLAYVVSAQWFSQYDTAKIILSGECALCGTGADNAPLLYREEHYPDKMFLLKGGTLTAQTDAFEATFQEIVPTRYARKRS